MIAHATYADDPYLGANPRFAAVAKARKELGVLLDDARKAQRHMRASYDAASQRDGLLNYWANADNYDADSANSRDVRHKLIARSRYEVNNNGYSDGIAQTYATDLVGLGPQLRMQTGSEGFNRLVETEWYRWCKAVQFRRKLWTQAHAKHQDGEGFAVARRNPRVKHPVQIDYVLYEAEQFQTPYLSYLEPGYIDGIKFDEFGNPEYYDLMRFHPGATGYATFDYKPERIAANFVFQWLKLRRPGQHRGIPECASTLNVGASARRWREAQLSTAEKIARFTLFLESNYPADTAELVDPMSVLDIQDGMMTTLPDGLKPHQLDPKHPAAAHESFHKSLVNEQARPKSMPYNKAACDSSSYNYASGRLDHQTYYSHLDVDREDCNDLVLDPLFDLWFELAVGRFGWLGGNAAAISAGARAHLWDWPKHRVADIEAEADANKTKLTTGETTLPRVYTDSGLDYEDELAKQATANGVSLDQQRQINMLLNLPQHVIPVVQQIIGVGNDKNKDTLDLALAIQKVYLGVGKVVTAPEAREIVNRMGAGLTATVPDDFGMGAVGQPPQFEDANA